MCDPLKHGVHLGTVTAVVCRSDEAHRGVLLSVNDLQDRHLPNDMDAPGQGHDGTR
jgi:hypothetical protein